MHWLLKLHKVLTCLHLDSVMGPVLSFAANFQFWVKFDEEKYNADNFFGGSSINIKSCEVRSHHVKMTWMKPPGGLAHFCELDKEQRANSGAANKWLELILDTEILDLHKTSLIPWMLYDNVRLTVAVSADIPCFPLIDPIRLSRCTTAKDVRTKRCYLATKTLTNDDYAMDEDPTSNLVYVLLPLNAIKPGTDGPPHPFHSNSTFEMNITPHPAAKTAFHDEYIPMYTWKSKTNNFALPTTTITLKPTNTFDGTHYSIVRANIKWLIPIRPIPELY